MLSLQLSAQFHFRVLSTGSEPNSMAITTLLTGLQWLSSSYLHLAEFLWCLKRHSTLLWHFDICITALCQFVLLYVQLQSPSLSTAPVWSMTNSMNQCGRGSRGDSMLVVQARDCVGISPADIASKNNHPAAVELLCRVAANAHSSKPFVRAQHLLT